MATPLAALTGTPANMAAIETEFQTNWADADFMRGARRANVYVWSDLAAAQTLRLWVRSPLSDGAAPVWAPHPDGAATSPANVTTAGDEWRLFRFQISEEWSGLVVSASAACDVHLMLTDLP